MRDDRDQLAWYEEVEDGQLLDERQAELRTRNKETWDSIVGKNNYVPGLKETDERDWPLYADPTDNLNSWLNPEYE